MTTLKIVGKNIHLDIGEKEMLQHLIDDFNLTERQALDEVIGYKREQALLYEQQGNLALAEHILKSIDEWDDSRAQIHKALEGETIGLNNTKKIILPI
jgi:hypothetical protein